MSGSGGVDMVTAEQLREIAERVKRTNTMTADDFVTFCYAMIQSMERLAEEVPREM